MQEQVQQLETDDEEIEALIARYQEMVIERHKRQWEREKQKRREKFRKVLRFVFPRFFR